MIVKLMKAKRPHKYKVIIDGKTIKFGADGYSDFTLSKDEEKKKNYLARHEVRENWNLSGIKTAGFWSRWLLWNKPTIKESIKDIENRFNINIIF